VKTRYCYEYVYYSDAILKIDSTYGYTIGEIIFVGDGGAKCDIEKLLRWQEGGTLMILAGRKRGHRKRLLILRAHFWAAVDGIFASQFLAEQGKE
jgi:hypothetical protein